MKRFKNVILFVLVLAIMIAPSYVGKAYVEDAKPVLVYDIVDNALVPRAKNPKEQYIQYPSYYKNGYSVEDSKFDIRYNAEKTNVTTIRNQNLTESCWAYSSNSLVESSMVYNYGEKYDLASSHIDYMLSRSFSDFDNNKVPNRKVDQQGNFIMSAAFYASDLGPVSLKDFADVAKYPSTSISYKDVSDLKTVLDVVSSNIQMFSTSNITSEGLANAQKYIKNEIIKYGAVGVSVRSQDKNTYNPTTGAWYNNSSESSDHGVSLVGWDDEYDKNNFLTTPAGNGAWIMKNSWGESAGDKGYYYVSYYDLHIYQNVFSVREVEKDVEDNTYYQKVLPITGRVTGGSLATVFYTKTVGESVSEITIGYLNENEDTEIELYINPASDSLDGIFNNQPVANGTIKSSEYNVGYYTFHLNKPVTLTGSKFAVAVVAKKGNIGVTMSSPDNNWFKYSSSAGISYAYYSSKWMDVTTLGSEWASVIPAVFVGTNNPDPDTISASEPKMTYSSGSYDMYIYQSMITTTAENDSDISVKVLNSNNEDKTSLFTTKLEKVEKGYNLTVSNLAEAEAGDYVVELTYNDKKTSFKIAILADAIATEVYDFSQGIISNVQLNTKADVFYKNFKVYGFDLYDGETKIEDLENTIIKTGMIAKTKNSSFTISVLGDFDGNGVLDEKDIEKMKKSVLLVEKLKDIEFRSLDVNRDNVINAVDVLIAKRYYNKVTNTLN